MLITREKLLFSNVLINKNIAILVVSLLKRKIAMSTTQTLSERREQANRLVNEIIEIKDSISDVKQEAEGILSSIDKNDVEYKKLIKKLDEISKQNDERVKAFRISRDTIKNHLGQAERFYKNKYLPLAEKIDNKESGFKAKIGIVDKQFSDFEKIKGRSEAQFEEIKKLVAEHKEQVKIYNASASAIKKLHTSSLSYQSKIERAHELIKGIEVSVKQQNKNINQINTEVIDLKKSVVKSESSSTALLENIEIKHTEAKAKLKAIQDVYEISHETGLSGEFEKRRNMLKGEIKKWERFVMGTSIVLFVCLIGLFILQLKFYEWKFPEGFDYNFYLRFLLFSPVVYYLYFCSSKQHKASKLYDKYSFKTTLAMSIKAHIKLLTEEEVFNESQRMDKILDFILDGFNKIYNEPYVDEQLKMKIKLANIKFDLQKSILDSTGIDKDELKKNLVKSEN
ncbi:hypothetical protein [Carboxylicivirga marina]|uniref:hypothetical protein n=1 Tax=Carboxylicivirga marina TaxID=2800988 RepID=UPI002593B923|nr:hypothetical protein [uncultured Carboxylicivirga sp.]